VLLFVILARDSETNRRDEARARWRYLDAEQKQISGATFSYTSVVMSSGNAGIIKLFSLWHSIN